MKGVGPSWVCKTCVRGGVPLQPGHASVPQVGSGSYRQYLLLRRLDREALAVVHVHGASHGAGRRERNALSRRVLRTADTKFPCNPFPFTYISSRKRSRFAAVSFVLACSSPKALVLILRARVMCRIASLCKPCCSSLPRHTREECRVRAAARP